MDQAPRHPTLTQLDALVGEWEMQASYEGKPLARTRTSFAWRDDGAFLVQRIVTALQDMPPEWQGRAPTAATTVTGLDDASGALSTLYTDSRGVYRIYQARIDDGVWQMWRDAPGFHQRFTVTLGSGNRTMTGGWEIAEDGSTWRTDFDLAYTRIG